MRARNSALSSGLRVSSGANVIIFRRIKKILLHKTAFNEIAYFSIFLQLNNHPLWQSDCHQLPSQMIRFLFSSGAGTFSSPHCILLYSRRVTIFKKDTPKILFLLNTVTRMCYIIRNFTELSENTAAGIKILLPRYGVQDGNILKSPPVFSSDNFSLQ